MAELKIFIPKSQEFQRLAQAACSAGRHMDDQGAATNSDLDALMSYFDFLAPEQLERLMGPGLAAEISAITEVEFPLNLLDGKGTIRRLLLDYTSMFAGAFCSYGTEKPRCYRDWLQIRQREFLPGGFAEYECLAESSFVVNKLGEQSSHINSKLQLLQYRILRRMAEVLDASGYSPEDHLRKIQIDVGPSPAQVLAMQVLVLQGKNADDLMRFCGNVNGSSEDTLLYWAAQGAFVHYLLEQWQWLRPIRYDQPSALSPDQLKERGGPLYRMWTDGSNHPAGLVRRELPGSDNESKERFPCVLDADQQERFFPVPLMLIGGPEVGKTSFLCALARHLNQTGGTLQDGLHLESNDLQGLWESRRELWESRERASTAQTAHYKLRIRSQNEIDVARWMRLRFTDYKGEDITQERFPDELINNLRAAKGLLFFVDDRYFPDLLAANEVIGGLPQPAGAKVSARPAGEWFRNARDLAAWYTRILQFFLDENRSAIHLPVGLVVNKADKLLGAKHFLTLKPPFLIPENVRMELVHAGLGLTDEPRDPFDRLQHCIRYDLTNSRDLRNQHFIFEFVKRFRGFITAALSQTYRFQIFFTSSVVPEDGRIEDFPYGVWEAVKWTTNNIELPYRIQVRKQLEVDQLALENLRKSIQSALVRDSQAFEDFNAASTLRDEVLRSTVQVKGIDKLLRRDPDSIKKRLDSATETMRTALGEVLTLAKLKSVAEETDPAPFSVRRVLAKEALERLGGQIAYLKGWRDRASAQATRT